MLKMILADDEYIVRDGLRNIIPWEEYGIEVVAEASDGQEAYSLCQELNPDILFTDIRMPIMDGLEVAMKLQEQGSSTRIIIISGIQDFTYAKTALDVNAEGYILKPVKINELKDVIRKVVSRINMERNSQEKLLKMKNQLHENMPVMRENFLRNVIAGIHSKEQDMDEKIQFFSIPFNKNEKLVTAVLQIDDYNNTICDYKEENKQLLLFSVNNIIEEIVNNYDSGLCITMNENEFVLIFNEKSLLAGKHMEICEEIVSCLNKFLKISVSIGVGDPANDLSNLNQSYKDALSALQGRFYTGKNSILNAKDVNVKNKNIEFPNLYEKENKFINCLKLGDSDGTAKTLDEIFEFFCSNNSLPVGYVQSICMELVCIASRNMYELDENIDNIVANRTAILEKIYRTENIFELKDYMLSVFHHISDYFSSKYNQKNSKAINKIKEIIKRHYMKNIGVSEISSEIYLSPNYISLIFKKETGQTITEYLTEVRMTAAKELLKTTDFKVFEIAEMVGYENPHYFSTVFKKFTGIHPQKYRSFTSS